MSNLHILKSTDNIMLLENYRNKEFSLHKAEKYRYSIYVMHLHQYLSVVASGVGSS